MEENDIETNPDFLKAFDEAVESDNFDLDQTAWRLEGLADDLKSLTLKGRLHAGDYLGVEGTYEDFMRAVDSIKQELEDAASDLDRAWSDMEDFKDDWAEENMEEDEDE